MNRKFTLKYDKLYTLCARVLFPALLFLYSLRHIRYGVEWWDTGYNYGNFRFMENMDSMWVFSTYLGNALGRLFTRLPMGDRMLGLNFYTGLLVCLLALGGYFFFTVKLKMPAWLVFAAEMIAVGLCWCPTALLYNYLTYVFLFAGVVCLYVALSEDRRRYFILAGICLGVNVFVRFPNLAEMALIVAVWAYAVIEKKSIKETAAETGWCLLGYLLGAGGVLGYISFRYGFAEYIGAIGRLFGMTGDATDYTLYSMVFYQLQNFVQNFRWMGILLFFTALGTAGFLILPGKYRGLKRTGYVLCVVLVFRLLMNRNMFNMKYSTKMSVFQWAVMLLSVMMILGVITILRRKADSRDKLLCGLSMIVIVITPLGSNNHLYSSINNLFFVAPVALWMLWNYLSALKKEYRLGGRITVSSFPLIAMAVMVMGMLLIQSIGFGFGYVFSESDGGENLHTRIQNSDILNGMYTDETRAKQLESLIAYTQQNNLAGQELILYGQIPALSYYLDMPFAITAWPDLKSYGYDVMKLDLEQAGEKIEAGGKPPVLLLEINYGRYLTAGEDALKTIAEDKKFALLCEFAEDYGYEPVFENSKFMMLRTAK